ncbi:flagellar basal body rod protein FlgB [Fictibacillus enclensis]|uniref:flagellar basal body rod protein FlgB n=1 Tax=Fictibacillus enclensis TaxID=1017270 RepID=UPI0025A03EA9|nr:flagellar basal body rod protein FlgB [Fictibacillus enclensis]MDM5338065.1 flagellar basal body rod protein FlgB [Fictibacillus enclensis]
MFSSPVFQMLERSLDGTALKQKAISDNIANINTPNYKAKNVEFHSKLQESLQAYRTESRHLDFSSGPMSGYSVTTSNSTEINNNGNNVDLDEQMSELAKNQIMNQALVQQLNGKFNSIQMVIKGGRA